MRTASGAVFPPRRSHRRRTRRHRTAQQAQPRPVPPATAPLRHCATGRISYGLHLYYVGILMYLEQVLPHSPWETRTAIVLPVTIAIAAASWHYVESHFLSAGNTPTPCLRGGRKTDLRAI